MNRRSFLTRSGLALGALIVGDEALEAMARLTHVRKSFPGAGVSRGREWVVTGISFHAGVGTITTARLEVISPQFVRADQRHLQERGVITLDADGFRGHRLALGDRLLITTEPT